MRHTQDFLDDRRLWQHELAENPKQPLALRAACQDAMSRHRSRDALLLALRGFEASEGWSGPQPDRAEFAARAARSLELVTLDSDGATLAQIVDFYDTFLNGQGTARLHTNTVKLSIEAAGLDVRYFRKGDSTRVAMTKLWAALAATRTERCDKALPWVRDYLSESHDTSEHISASLVFGRCSQWEEALRVARGLDTTQPAIAELVQNLESIRTIAGRERTQLEDALAWSRARTLLLDRGGAYQALVPWRDEIIANQQGALFFARTAWAAGEDEPARAALAFGVSPEQASDLLATWSRELDRP